MIGLDVILAKPEGKARGENAAPEDSENSEGEAALTGAEGWLEALAVETGAPQAAPDAPLALEGAAGAPSTSGSFVFRQDVLVTAPKAAPNPETETPEIALAEAPATDVATSPPPVKATDAKPSPPVLDAPFAAPAPIEAATVEAAAPTKTTEAPTLQSPAQRVDPPIQAAAPELPPSAPALAEAPVQTAPALTAPATPVAQVQQTVATPAIVPEIAAPKVEEPPAEARLGQNLLDVRRGYASALIAPIEQPTASPPPATQTPLSGVNLQNVETAGAGVEIADIESLERLEGVAASRAAATADARLAGATSPIHAQAQAHASAISGQIRVAFAAADNGRIDIRLDPPELGRVSVTIMTRDDVTTAMVSAERSEVVDLLRRHSDMLARDLAEAGFENLTLDFSSKDSAKSGETGAGSDLAGLGEDGGADDGARTYTRINSADRLDIRI